ncbi:MAG: D-alanine--D-alanine ligase, partial [Ruminiclostridium sp.]|nr:D-alanine--D-alanine ligase [Ruminiclostridium sp.]
MKIRVGVFFGGNSVEHEVSIISALQACNSINKDKYEVIPVYIAKNNEMYVGENIGKISAYKNLKALLKESKRVILVNDGGKVQLVLYPGKKFGSNVYSAIDVAFPIVHGTNVEDGVFQGYLQTIGVPYVGCDVISSAVGMDKYVMKTVFKDNGIPVLDGIVVHISDFAKDEEA